MPELPRAVGPRRLVAGVVLTFGHVVETRATPTLGPAAFARTSGGREDVVLEAVAQVLLGELADAGLGDLLDEDHIVGEPPLGDAAVEELEDVLLGGGLA